MRDQSRSRLWRGQCVRLQAIMGYSDDEYAWFAANGHAGTTYDRPSSATAPRR